MPASARSAGRASASTTQVSADLQQPGSLPPEVQAHIADAMGTLRTELQKDLKPTMTVTVLQALKAFKDSSSSPAPSLTSRQWTGTYAGQAGLWKQDSDSGSWTLLENTPTKDPFQSPEGDPWRTDSSNPGGALPSAPASIPPPAEAVSRDVVQTSRAGGVTDSAPASSPHGYYDYASSSTPYYSDKWTSPPRIPPKKEFVYNLLFGTGKTQRVSSETG